MFSRFPIMRSTVSRITAVGVITSAILLSPYSISLPNAFAKSQDRELIFASKTKVEDVTESSKEDTKALKAAKEAIEDKKLKVKFIDPKEEVPSGYDAVAYHYKDVKKDKDLKRSLQNMLTDGKMVYIYGGLTVEEYCDLLDIDTIYAQMEVDGSDRSKKVSFGDSKKAEKNPKSQNNSIHEIIGYTLNEDAAYSVFISDVNNYDDKGKKSDLTNEIFLKEILEHENSEIEKAGGHSETAIINPNVASAASVVKSNYDIVASAYSGGEKVGHFNSQWKLYKESDDDDEKDYFYIKDTTSFYQDRTGWDAEVFDVKHEMPFASDEIDDADPNDTTSSPYKVSIGYPFSLSFEYELKSDANYDLTLNKDDDIVKWHVDDNELEQDGDDYEFVTAWASSGTYAGINITHNGRFDYDAAAIGAYTDHSISVRYDYD